MVDTKTQDGGKTVLIIEDDKFLSDMYVLKLTERGYKVIIANSGDDAMGRIKEETLNPDIVLLDLVMPGMGGFEFLEAVREQNLLEDAVVIILSNLGQKEDIERGKALGASGYIVKASATPTEVVDRIGSIVGDK